MAEIEKQEHPENQELSKERKKELKKEYKQEHNSEEVSEKPAEENGQSEEKPKSYIHVDTFLKTAVPLFNLSNVQAAGFKAKMQGKLYQHDEQVFLDELKKHLNIDQDEKNEN